MLRLRKTYLRSSAFASLFSLKGNGAYLSLSPPLSLSRSSTRSVAKLWGARSGPSSLKGRVCVCVGFVEEHILGHFQELSFCFLGVVRTERHLVDTPYGFHFHVNRSSRSLHFPHRHTSRVIAVCFNFRKFYRVLKVTFMCNLLCF